MKKKPDKTSAQLGYPGRLIAVEGIDGSGKSTQLYLLKRWLELQGREVGQLRECPVAAGGDA